MNEYTVTATVRAESQAEALAVVDSLGVAPYHHWNQPLKITGLVLADGCEEPAPEGLGSVTSVVIADRPPLLFSRPEDGERYSRALNDCRDGEPRCYFVAEHGIYGPTAAQQLIAAERGQALKDRCQLMLGEEDERQECEALEALSEEVGRGSEPSAILSDSPLIRQLSPWHQEMIRDWAAEDESLSGSTSTS